MNVVIYARFSSHSQTEQSIEGQLKVCYEYAEANRYTVVGEYIDRAISGTTDNRAEFQRMISDSDKHTFEGVLVYQLDRFARNRYDSAINKAKLKKNGVRVLSAKENIADDASGILVEGVLESMAEYYSVELSQKIHRGMAINAEKCLSNGSNPGLGFKGDAERRFYVDEEEAATVREIYERYASGETKAEIIRDLKRRRIKTSLGKEFSPNSLSHLLSNKRYIGVYLYKGKETPGGMPRILDDDLFYRVQSMMNKNKNAPARTHGEGEYLLTTKLFCGHCKEMMVGYGGTSKTGRQYHYYMCKNARRKKCGKKIVSKSYIEDRVVNECLKMLTEEKIRFIAKKVAEECAKSPDNLTAKALKKAIREADTAIENLWKAIERGQAVEMLTDRLNKRMAEKAELEAQLAIEENKKITLTEAQILAFLDYVCEMPADDVNKRRAIINIFVHSIYLYDDHFTLIINASKKPLSIDNVPLDDSAYLPGKQDFRVPVRLIAELFSNGIAMALMYCVVDLGSVIFQRANNHLGETIISAHTASRRIIGIMMQPLATISTASSTFVGQNWGARKPERIRTALRQVTAMELAWSLFGCALIYAFGGTLVRLTTGTSDTEVVRNAVMSLRWHLTFFPALGCLLVLRTAMQAMGQKTAPILSSCIELGMKLLSAAFLIPHLGFFGTSITEPVTWTLMLLFLAIVYFTSKKRLFSKITVEMGQQHEIS